MKNFTHEIIKRELGLLPPIKLQNNVSCERISRLEMSKYRDIKVEQSADSGGDDEEQEEEVMTGHSAAVTAISVEDQEGRYLLAGTADGGLYIHDLANMTGCPKTSSQVVATVKPVTPPVTTQPPATGRQSGAHNSRRPQNPSGPPLNGHWQSIQTVSWYPGDNGLFVTSGMDERLLVWDANEMQVAEEFKIGKPIYCHQMSSQPDVLIAVASSSNHIRLIDLKSGSSTHELRGHAGSLISVRWSSQRKELLASGSVDGQVLLWDVRRAACCLKAFDMDQISNRTPVKPHAAVRSHSGPVNDVAFCDDGVHLISHSSSEGKLRRWNILTGHNTKTKFTRLSTKQNKLCSKISLSPSYGKPFGLAFVPEGSNVAVVDICSGSLKGRLRGHYDGVKATALSELHQELYTSGGDRQIFIWENNFSNTGAYTEYLNTVTL